MSAARAQHRHTSVMGCLFSVLFDPRPRPPAMGGLEPQKAVVELVDKLKKAQALANKARASGIKHKKAYKRYKTRYEKKPSSTLKTLMRSHLRDAHAFNESYLMYQGVVNDHERELASVRKKVAAAEVTKMRAEFRKARRGVKYDRVSNVEEADQLVEEDEDLDDEVKDDEDRLNEVVGHMAKRGVVDDDDERLSDLDALGDSGDELDVEDDARSVTASTVAPTQTEEAEESPASTRAPPPPATPLGAEAPAPRPPEPQEVAALGAPRRVARPLVVV